MPLILLTVSHLTKRNYEFTFISIQDSLDWKEYGVDKEVSTVLNHKNLRNGSIILFHNDTKFTPDALPRIIEGLKEKGYELVPLSELIIQEDYTVDHTGRQFPVKVSGDEKSLE